MTIYAPQKYTGYVYIWFDTKASLFYVGGHYGKVEDCYVCSSVTMKKAYNKRPESFRMRVLEYTFGTVCELRECEQKWLNMIKDEELLLTENVKNKTAKYYNVKKTSMGGSHKGHKKNRTAPAWNKGLVGKQIAWNKGLTKCDFRVEAYGKSISKALKGKPKSEDHKIALSVAQKGKKLSESHKLSMRKPKRKRKCFFTEDTSRTSE